MPLVAVFLMLGAMLGPSGLNVLDVGLESPQLRVLAILALTLVLFSDAVTLETRELRAQRMLALRVLGPGTLLPAGLISVAAWLLLDLPAPAAAIVGCALASTDPVLLRSVLRSRAIPSAPRIALRLESGMNDAVLLPIVVLAMALLRAHGAPIPVAEIRHHVVGLFVLGPVLGALVGFLGIVILGQIRDGVGVRRDYESIYALGLAFTAYAVAEAVGGSGFLAAFFAGLLVAMQDVELCDCFLEYGEATAEMLLLLTFVALGTSLIWSGLSILSVRTLAFAVVALGMRTVVLYPMLAGTNLGKRDRWIIALFGPRGLSSLLFVLLPVFAGVDGAEQMFQVTALVVLMSVVIHGGGIAVFIRRNRAGGERVGGRQAGGSQVDGSQVGGTQVDGLAGGAGRRLSVIESDEGQDERISIDEVRAIQARGGDVIIVDARADRSYRADPRTAEGSVRVEPEDPVRDATELRLSQTATLAVYCA